MAAMIFRQRSSLSTALATFAAVLLLGGCRGRSSEDYIAAGNKAMQSNNLVEAEENYQKAVTADPTNQQAHIALGDLYIFEHKPAQAQAEFMLVIENNPKDPAAHIALGDVYMAQSEFPEAEAQYRAAVALDPSAPSSHVALGAALVKKNRPDEAETEFRTAIGLDPKNAKAHFQLANLLATEPNRAAEANAEYQQAQALDPTLKPPVVATTAAPAPAGAPAATSNVKPLNKLWLVTHNSPMYANPDATSAVVGKIRRGGMVHVTGIAGKDWLQVTLRNGTVGFVPVTATE